MIVVADSGPIHYLVLTGDIGVLPALFGHVLIPDAVRGEPMQPRTPVAVHAWISNPPSWAEIRSVRRSTEEELARLGPGEQEAIVLAREVLADYLPIDDARGILFAESHQIRTVGTIGILREASAKNLIDFMSSFQKLMATNFRISSSFRERILKDLERND
jgi:predicted nucleic acid-binding protein